MKTQNKKIILDLAGEDGNANVLLGYAQRYTSELGLQDKGASIMADMTSGNYDHLVQVFRNNFSNYVKLIN